MEKVFVQNLSILVTDSCNFNCRHCMRGNIKGCEISDETIDNIFNKIQLICNLCICGGEPLMALDRIKRIFDVIMRKGIIINQYGFATNGTQYKEKVVNELFDVFEEYVKSFSDRFYGDGQLPNGKTHGYIDLSWDEYHKEQLLLLKQINPNLYEEYLEKIRQLQESKYFSGYRTITQRLFDEGYAKELTIKKSKLIEIKKYYTNHDDVLFFGPIIGIAQNGMITECNGSYDTLKDKYNYGNINDDNIIDVIQNISTKCKSLKQWDKKIESSIRKYTKYK